MEDIYVCNTLMEYLYYILGYGHLQHMDYGQVSTFED